MDWGNYFETCQALVQCMEISTARDGPLDYPAGSMFWTLGSSASLLDLDLKVSDFPDEQGQIDGTLAHAIERLFFNVCEVLGFRWGPRWRCARYSTPRMADQDSPTQ